MADLIVFTSIAGVSENCSVLFGAMMDGEERELRMEKLECLRDTYVANVSMSGHAAEHCQIGLKDEHGESDYSVTRHCLLWWCPKPHLEDAHKHILFVHQGTDVHVCGNIAPLGNWDPLNITYPQRSLANGLGVSVVCVSSDITDFEYKLIKKDSDSVTWEEPAFVNRRVSLETSGDVIITGDWGDNSSLVVTEIKTSKFDASENVISQTLGDVISQSVGDVISKSVGDVISKKVSDVISTTLRDVISKALIDAINKPSRDVTSKAARSTESERESHQHEAARTQSAPVVGPSSDCKAAISGALRNYADLAATASTPAVSTLQPGSSVRHKPRQPSKIDISELVSNRYGTWPTPKRGLLRRAYSAAASAGHSMRKQISTTRLLRKLTA